MRGTVRRQTLSFPPDMLESLKAEAERRSLSLSEVVRERIRAGEPQPQPQPSRGVAYQVLCPTCKLWKAPPGRNPGLIAGVCMCDSKREALR